MVDVPSNGCAITSKGGVDIVGVASSDGFLINDGWDGAQKWIESEGGDVRFTMIDGNGDEVGQYTATCGWSICKYGPNANWSERTIETDDGDKSFGGDALLFVQGFESAPDAWPDVNLDSQPSPEVALTDDVIGQGCTPLFDSVNIEVSNPHFCKGMSGSVNITNEVTGDTTTESFDLSAGSSTTIFYSFEVDEAQDGEQKFLTIDVSSNFGGTSITRRGVIGNEGDVITLTEARAPSQATPGETLDFDVTLENSGDCGENVDVRLTNNANDDVVTETDNDIFSGSSSTVRLDYQVPEVGQKEVDFTADVIAGGEIVASSTKTVTTAAVELDITEFNAPDSICVGEDFVVSTRVDNAGNRGGDIRLVLENTVTGDTQRFGPESIPVDGSVSRDFNESLTIESSKSDIVPFELRVEAESDGAFSVVQTDSIKITPKLPSFTIESASTPDEVCVGDSVNLSAQVINDSDCDGDVTVEVTNRGVGDTQTFGPKQLSSGNTTNAEFSETISQDLAGAGSVDYTFRVKRRTADGLQTVDDTTQTVKILESNLSITSASHPDFIEPQETTETIEVTNNGDCAADARITVGSLDQEFTIASGVSETFEQTFEVLADPVQFTATVENQTLGRTSDTQRIRVRPHKYNELNTSDGIVDIVGGYESGVDYGGTIVGSDLSAQDNLEDQDTFVSALGAGTLKGVSSTKSDDKDTVEFTSIQLLTMKTSQKVTWIVDGSNEGKSDTFKYETASSSAFGPGRDVDIKDPEISIMGGPINNVGVLRRKMGINKKLISRSIASRL